MAQEYLGPSFQTFSQMANEPTKFQNPEELNPNPMKLNETKPSNNLRERFKSRHILKFNGHLNFLYREKVLLFITLLLGILFIILCITFFTYLSKSSQPSSVNYIQAIQPTGSSPNDGLCESLDCLRISVEMHKTLEKICSNQDDWQTDLQCLEQSQTSASKIAYDNSLKLLMADFKSFKFNKSQLKGYNQAMELFHAITNQSFYRQNNLSTNKEFNRILENISLSQKSLTSIMKYLEEWHGINLFLKSRLDTVNETMIVFQLELINLRECPINLDQEILSMIANREQSLPDNMIEYISGILELVQNPNAVLDRIGQTEKISGSRLDRINDIILFFRNYNKLQNQSPDKEDYAYLSENELTTLFSQSINFKELSLTNTKLSNFRGRILFKVKNLTALSALADLLLDTTSIKKQDIISFYLMHHLVDIIRPSTFTTKIKLLPRITNERPFELKVLDKLNGPILANLLSWISQHSKTALDIEILRRTMELILQGIRRSTMKLLDKFDINSLKSPQNLVLLRNYVKNSNYGFYSCDNCKEEFIDRIQNIQKDILGKYLSFMHLNYQSSQDSKADFGYQSQARILARFKSNSGKIEVSPIVQNYPLYSQHFPLLITAGNIGLEVAKLFSEKIFEEINLEKRNKIKRCISEKIQITQINDVDLKLLMAISFQNDMIREDSSAYEKLRLPGIFLTHLQTSRLLILQNIDNRKVSSILKEEFREKCSKAIELQSSNSRRQKDELDLTEISRQCFL